MMKAYGDIRIPPRPRCSATLWLLSFAVASSLMVGCFGHQREIRDGGNVGSTTEPQSNEVVASRSAEAPGVLEIPGFGVGRGDPDAILLNSGGGLIPYWSRSWPQGRANEGFKDQADAVAGVAPSDWNHPESFQVLHIHDADVFQSQIANNLKQWKSLRAVCIALPTPADKPASTWSVVEALWKAPHIEQLKVVGIRGAARPSPDVFARLARLEALELEADLDDDLLAAVGAARQLKILYVGTMSVSDQGWHSLGQLKQLEVLGLHAKAIGDPAVEAISQLRRLRVLTFGGKLRASEEAIGKLKGLRDVRYLALPRMDKESVKLLPALLSFGRPRYLSVRTEKSLGGKDLERIGSMPDLAYLDLSFCDIVDEDLQYLAHSKDLEVLNLMATDVKGPGLRYLERCQSLRLIWTSMGLQWTPEAERLGTKLPRLQFYWDPGP